MQTRSRSVSALILLAALAACGRGDEARETGSDGTVISAEEAANIPPAPGDEPAGVTQDGTARLDRLAGVTVGMTIAQLRSAGFQVEKDDGPDPDNRCGYARIAQLKAPFFMLDGDRIVRIDVDRPGYPTLGGVDIGMSETEAQRRLGKSATVQRNLRAGAASHLFLVHEAGAPHGLIVETDGARVVSYRLGEWEAVQSSEECL